MGNQWGRLKPLVLAFNEFLGKIKPISPKWDQLTFKTAGSLKCLECVKIHEFEGVHLYD